MLNFFTMFICAVHDRMAETEGGKRERGQRRADADESRRVLCSNLAGYLIAYPQVYIYIRALRGRSLHYGMKEGILHTMCLMT